MQPSYKDPWPVSQAFRKMMANDEMNKTHSFSSAQKSL